jgi:hypothetical protein
LLADKANADIHQLRQQRRSESAIGAADAKTDLHAPKTSSGEPSGFFCFGYAPKRYEHASGPIGDGVGLQNGRTVDWKRF